MYIATGPLCRLVQMELQLNPETDAPESHPAPAVAIDMFLAFMEANPIGTRVDIKAMIEAGRA
jgi:hypothetical protein